jgi:hypothetical protein
MASFNEYWQYARACERWAAEAKDRDDQELCLDMAKAWTNIALVESDVAKQSLSDCQVQQPGEGRSVVNKGLLSFIS